MKKCTRCGQEKSLDEFNFKKRSLNLRHYQCKECTRAFVRNHYNTNRAYYLKKARKRNLANRLIIQRYIRRYFSLHPCVDCGESDFLVLEFDHRGNKINEVSNLIKGRYPLLKVKEEIQKCDVRCANCHRRKTAKQFRWFWRIN